VGRATALLLRSSDMVRQLGSGGCGARFAWFRSAQGVRRCGVEWWAGVEVGAGCDEWAVSSER
jgi:hypothetical protein